MTKLVRIKKMSDITKHKEKEKLEGKHEQLYYGNTNPKNTDLDV